MEGSQYILIAEIKNFLCAKDWKPLHKSFLQGWLVKGVVLNLLFARATPQRL